MFTTSCQSMYQIWYYRLYFNCTAVIAISRNFSAIHKKREKTFKKNLTTNTVPLAPKLRVGDPLGTLPGTSWGPPGTPLEKSTSEHFRAGLKLGGWTLTTNRVPLTPKLRVGDPLGTPPVTPSDKSTSQHATVHKLGGGPTDLQLHEKWPLPVLNSYFLFVGFPCNFTLILMYGSMGQWGNTEMVYFARGRHT